MPFSCAASTASAICLAICRVSPSSSGPPAMRSASVEPSTSSITRARTPSDSESVDSGDVGMVERGEDLRFAREAGHIVGIAG